MELRREAVDHLGRLAGSYRAGTVPGAEREFIWEGEALEPGLWQFVVELRDEGKDLDPKRAHAKFVVAPRSQLLVRRGFDRKVAKDLILRGNTMATWEPI